jgi:hypothetical protein
MFFKSFQSNDDRVRSDDDDDYEDGDTMAKGNLIQFIVMSEKMIVLVHLASIKYHIRMYHKINPVSDLLHSISLNQSSLRTYKKRLFPG